MGANHWLFNSECDIIMVQPKPNGINSSVDCACNFENDTYCHVVGIEIKGYSLPGVLPPELVKLRYLRKISLLGNRLSGEIPKELGNISSLTYLRINDNNFSGAIPDFIQNWKQLTRLEMHGSGLEGPIPSNISLLNKLTELRISDINGTGQEIPNLSNATGLTRLVLRNCNISGRIPEYIGKMSSLQMLDLSFNRLVGEIPNDIVGKRLNFLFLSGNMLRGNISDSILKDGSSIKGVLPCMKDFSCPRYECSLHVNCGGNDITTKENNKIVDYEGDAQVEGGTAKYFRSNSHWGFSSTGDFMDDNDYQNARFTKRVASTNISELLGRRIFDIYIQGKLVEKDFNIEDEASGAQKQLTRPFNASVTENILEIRFYWAGKGTTRIPDRGVYGPLISAISVDPNFKSCSDGGKKNVTAYVAVGVVAPCIIFVLGIILWWKGWLKGRKSNGRADQLILDWPTRLKICTGIARGLAFLHEESRLKIVHRDIKATNVLLDGNLDPKISDFGLARLNEDENTHISTRVAGTIGYMAPEYALWGYLTYKADVYSFGIVALEIVSGKNNNSYIPSDKYICLLDWACHLQQGGNFADLVDPKLGGEVNQEEAERMIKVALLCTNASPSLRPTMSEAVRMLEGRTRIPDVIPEASSYTDDLRFKAMRDFYQERPNPGSSGTQT
ncbi:leucine-rich repeat transmembrane protein kinase [Actinidia rufa]|uniref:non-specific serine/threonine protein kinase n=1 Tax=Actinidia rufa TaxID=165716 RepID=A0A7J0DV54_9ERIC|nr:leucine-rich repeat transmembrane protein kinase [Actinidia rufa]